MDITIIILLALSIGLCVGVIVRGVKNYEK